MGRKRKTLTVGDRHGLLTVVGPAVPCGVNFVSASCFKCDCGLYCCKSNSAVTHNGARSCGFCRTPKAERYGRTSVGFFERNPKFASRREWMAEMWSSGVTLRTIAKKFGVTYQRVQQIMASCGAKRHDRWADSEGIIRQLCEDGCSHKDICTVLGCARQTVAFLMKRFAISYDRRKAKLLAEERRLVGVKKNRLTFLRFAEDHTPTRRLCWFLCECEREFKCLISNWRQGFTKSCGCALADYRRALSLGVKYDKATNSITSQLYHPARKVGNEACCTL